MKFKRAIAAMLTILTALIFFPALSVHAADAQAKKCSDIPLKYLNEQEAELYRLTLENVIAIAEGRQSAEAFYINIAPPFASKKQYEEAVEKVMFFIDKYTPEYSFWADSSGYRVYDTSKCGIIYGISPAYQAKNNTDRIDPAGLDRVKKALANAKTIADKYRDKNDYEKIIGYADEICSLNVYNRAAADDSKNYSQKNIDPWQIVYVFDNDPDTNVVCAGYAHAFQYLCSLGGIDCHYVSGTVNESHAWNIVELDGKNYFVDLTFCDGFPEEDIKRYHPYVLDNVVSNAQNGFSTYFMYSGSLSNDMETYKYSDDEIKYLPEALRTLSTQAYRKKGLRFEFWHFLLILLVAGAVIRFVKKRKAGGDN